MRIEEISFEGAGVQLSGSLLLPNVARECSGVVLIGGSGLSDRHNDGLFDLIGRHFVRSGVAVLAYDKRGAGGSSGSWAAATVDELAEDAAAAVTTLSSRREVGPVGALGHSEGGWVALRLGVRTTLAAYLIVQSCPGVSFVEAEVFALTRAGMQPEDAEAVAALLRALAKTAPTPEGFAEAQRLIAAEQSQRWYAVAEAQGFSFDETAWKQIRVWGMHDPRKDLEQLTLPTLVVFGGDDPLVPVEASLEAFETTAGRTHRRQRIAVLAGADHRLNYGEGFIPEYLPTLAEWARNGPER